MDKFVLLPQKDKRAYFEVAAANLNIMPQLIEKDFWVCWILKILFALPDAGSHLIEEKQKCQTKNLKRVTNFLPPKSLSGLSDVK